jgi:integrase
VRVRLKGLHRVRWPLKDGTFATYCYAWRGGPRVSGQHGTPEFFQSYYDALKQRSAPAKGLFFALIAEYRASAKYTSLSAHTKRAYSTYLKWIERDFGDLPIAALSEPAVRGEFQAWRDKMSNRPRAADYAWTTLARVLSFAKDRGRIPTNPCERGGRLYAANRADKVWGDNELARLLAVAPKPLALAALLALWTGQRQGDLLQLPWSAYDGRHIRLRQSKTKRTVVIPVSAALKRALDQTERRGTLILTNTHGHPWTSAGFRASWRALCAKAGVTDLTFHDLRGSAIVRLASAQATVPEIATFTGHSLVWCRGAAQGNRGDSAICASELANGWSTRAGRGRSAHARMSVVQPGAR